MSQAIEPKYSIGIEEMDIQHARWIKLIEAFRSIGTEHLADEVGLHAARQTLNDLLGYTRSHFVSEETFLKRHGYPGLNEHGMLHREIDGMLVKLHDDVEKHISCKTPLKLNLFITIWLMEHIVVEDRKYADYILGKH